jgi:hypothetical protein
MDIVIGSAAHDVRQRWKRLELCAPTLPEFEGMLLFCRRNGLEIAVGRKMKWLL